MSIQVVTVLDKEPEWPYLQMGWRAFNRSLERFDHKPLVLGFGEPWRGLGSKPKLLKRAIESGQIEAEHIIFSDALDVAFLADPERFVDAKKCFYKKAKIVWNGEKNCFPRADWAQYHPKTPSPFRFFNSGLSVGRTEDYLKVLTQCKVDERPDDYIKPDGKWHHENDQEFLMEKFLFGQVTKDEPKMAIDTKCCLFQNMVECSMEEFKLVDYKGMKCVENLATGSFPLAIHWAGNAKTSGTMEPILSYLDLL